MYYFNIYTTQILINVIQLNIIMIYQSNTITTNLFFINIKLLILFKYKYIYIYI